VDPFTIAAVAGAGIGAIGKLMGGASSSAMDKIQSQIYATNAGISETNASSLESQATVAAGGEGVAAAEGNLSVARIQEAGRETLAQQRNFFSSSNVDPTYGSPLLTMARTAGRVASDVDIARASAAIASANAQASSASLLTAAAGQKGQALSSLLSEQGANEKSSSDMMAGYLGAATSLLSGVGSLGGKGFSLPQINLSSFGFNPIAGVTGQ
jgi:hypothetical protein